MDQRTITEGSAILVLSRYTQEQVVIRTPEGREIIVTLVEIRGDKARIGFEAAREVAVHRREVQDAIEGKPAGAVQQLEASK